MIAAKLLWVEALGIRGMTHIHKEPMNSSERAWEVDLMQPVTNNWHMTGRRPNCLNTQLRMSDEDFDNWRRNLGCNSLVFDGASKGNPRLAGVGGVTFYPGGNKLKDYAWSVAKKSNYGVEWLALIKVLEIENSCEMEELAVYGDSLMVITEARKLNKNYKSLTIKLHHIFN